MRGTPGYGVLSKGSVMAELTVAVVVVGLTAVLLVVVRGLERL